MIEADRLADALVSDGNASGCSRPVVRPAGTGLMKAIRARRRGITLMEVMLSTVILLGAVMALSRVAFLARRHAEDAEDRSRAQLFCQNILQEVLAGVRAPQNVAPESFEGDQWVYMIDVEAVEGTELSKITVRVDRLDDTETTGRLPTEDEMRAGYQLVHWMRTGQSSPEAPGATDP